MDWVGSNPTLVAIMSIDKPSPSGGFSLSQLGVGGVLAANKSGIQGGTCRKILLAWAFTLPGTIVLSGILFAIGRFLVK